MAEKKESLMFEYFVPIQNSAELDGDFIINGIAINETTTSNGHKFISEELRKSASSLIGVPLLKDHDNSVDSIVGKVKMAHFNEDSKNIPFNAIVKDPKIKELIKDKLLNTVSVGAHVNPQDIEELDNGDIVPHNITFKELSVVAVPADNGATFQIALNNAYKGLHSQDENSNSNERGNETMTEEEIKKDEATAEAPEEKEAEKVEPAVTEEKVKSWVIEAIKSMKESDVDEEPKEEPKEESKEEEKAEEKEEEEAEDESEEVEEKAYTIKSGHRSFSLERKSYNYN